MNELIQYKIEPIYVSKPLACVIDVIFYLESQRFHLSFILFRIGFSIVISL